MPTFDLERWKQQGKRFADGFTPGQKAISVLGVVAVLAAGYFFMQWENKSSYAPLYSGLEPSDASDVTAKLDEQGTPYKLENGGTTIMVPKEDVYKVRIDLSAEGLPSGGHESFALLDEGGITKDEFSKRVDYQRALQGELARTIESIDGIQAASVTLTIPRETVFVGGEEDKASAAVLVKTGTTLPSETVQAIVHLVSSSVADMTPDQVTVADAAGTVLAAPGRSGVVASGEQREQTTAFEDDLARSVNNLIAASLGPGHSAVTATAQLDFNDTKTTTHTFAQPNNIEVPITKKTSTETFSGPGSGSTGILGPDGQPLINGADGGAGTTYNKQTVAQDNALNQIEKTVNQAPGGVKQVSVSVLLDAEAVPEGDVAQWETAITAAAGIDPNRNDVMAVTRVPFDEEAKKEAEKALSAAQSAQSSNAMADMLRSLVTLLIIGLVLFFAWRAIKKADSNRIPLRTPIDLRELEAAERASAELDAAESRLLELERSGRAPALVGSAGASVEAEIQGLIDRQPDEVAQTLRSWLADRRG